MELQELAPEISPGAITYSKVSKICHISLSTLGGESLFNTNHQIF